MSYTDFRNKRLHVEVKWLSHRGWVWSMRPLNRKLINKGKKP